jgi:hypothetical protein
MLAGLLAIIFIILQDLISSGVFNSSKMLDFPLLISAFAFAVALPLLSIQLLATFEDESRFFTIPNIWDLEITYWIAILSTGAGIVATFWHIWQPVGITSLVTIVISAGIYIHYRIELHRNDEKVRTEMHIVNIKDYEEGSGPPSLTKSQEVSQPQELRQQ